MKKTIALVLGLVMVLGCLSACGKAPVEETTTPIITQPTTEAVESGSEPVKVWFGQEDGVTPVHIKVWGGVQPEYGYTEVIANFNAAYADKGIEAEYIRYKNDTDGNLRVDTLLMGGGEDNIDVLVGYGGSSRLNNRVNSDLLIDYSSYLKEAGIDVAEALGVAAATEFVEDNGAIYGLPTTFSNNGYMMINVDMFRAAGIEVPYGGWTYTQFYDALAKLTSGEGQNKVYGICWGLNFEHTTPTGFCGETIKPFHIFTSTECTETNFDEPCWAEGLDLIKRSMDDGYAISLEEEIAEKADVASYFLTEKCAIFMTFSQIRLAMDTKNYGHTFSTALIPNPVPDELANDADQLMHTNCISQSDIVSIAKTTAYPDACAEFAKWYITGGNIYLLKGGRIPLYNGISADVILDTMSALAGDSVDAKSLMAFMGVDKNLVLPRVSSKASSEIGDLLWVKAQEILGGKIDAETAMRELKTEADQVIVKYTESK